MTCKVGALLAGGTPTWTKSDRTTLQRHVTCPYDERVSAATLSTALRAMGQDVGPTTIKDHRASRCACTRKATP